MYVCGLYLYIIIFYEKNRSHLEALFSCSIPHLWATLLAAASRNEKCTSLWLYSTDTMCE